MKQKTSVADVVHKEESPFWEAITQSPLWEAYVAEIAAALNKPQQSGEVSDSLVKE